MSEERPIRLQFNIPVSPGVNTSIAANTELLQPYPMSDVPVHATNSIKTSDNVLDNPVNASGKSSDMMEYLSITSSLKSDDKAAATEKKESTLGECLHGTKAVKQSKLDDVIRKQNNKFTGKYELQALHKHLTSANLNQKDLTKLSSWGLPPSTSHRYESIMNVSSLFQWQIDCLRAHNDESYLNGKNLIFSAPTSGGKTLVSELLMLRRLATVKGTILFVVPFISIAEEKVKMFRKIWQDLQISVRVFHGEDSSGAIRLSEDTDVAVCTIERANIILNQLLFDKQENSISMVVVDEVHMLGDEKRGFLLEIFLSKILYALSASVQIVAMSATIPNINDLSNWLNSALYVTEYRPIDLMIQVCIEGTLYDVIENHYWDKQVSNQPVVDTDGWLSLCQETLVAGKSLLLFCPTKERCEICAQILTKFLNHIKIPINPKQIEGRASLLSELRLTTSGLCSILEKTIRVGVAYHHAGLTNDERIILENAYKLGHLSVLCTTTTLAAGVNLPANRVIIREPKTGSMALNVAGFRQMAGRAGRTGYGDSSSGAILMCKPYEKKIAIELMTNALDPLHSCLHEGYGGGIEKLLLELITCERVKNLASITDAFKFTLLYKQQQDEVVIQKYIENSLDNLKKSQFILIQADGSLHSTQLGLATIMSGLSPKDAAYCLHSLQQAQLTPPHSSIYPNWSMYLSMLSSLQQDHDCIKPICDEIGIDAQYLASFEVSNKLPAFNNEDPKVLLHKRFFSSIILFQLTQEYPIRQLADVMQIKRGQIQSLQKDATVFCEMITTFCRKLNWNLLGSCLSTMHGRLNHGVQDELLPLVRGMGIDMPSHRARMLYKNKITDLRSLCECPIETIVEMMLAGNPYDARAPLHVGKVNIVEEKKKHSKIYAEIVQRMKDRAAVICGYSTN